jgi:hypothetical protein
MFLSLVEMLLRIFLPANWLATVCLPGEVHFACQQKGDSDPTGICLNPLMIISPLHGVQSRRQLKNGKDRQIPSGKSDTTKRRLIDRDDATRTVEPTSGDALLGSRDQCDLFF